MTRASERIKTVGLSPVMGFAAGESKGREVKSVTLNKRLDLIIEPLVLHRNVRYHYQHALISLNFRVAPL